jgi:hypothetical protein
LTSLSSSFFRLVELVLVGLVVLLATHLGEALLRLVGLQDRRLQIDHGDLALRESEARQQQ